MMKYCWLRIISYWVFAASLCVGSIPHNSSQIHLHQHQAQPPSQPPSQHYHRHHHHHQHPALGEYKGKIAFMFLSRGELPHESLWELFFNFHAPTSHYSIYWHTHPEYKPPPHSFFRAKQLAHLIPTKWAEMSVTDAIRNMMREALKDPENMYFVLLSESCIPLLPFTIWYRTMMYYSKEYSLTNACDFGAKAMETNSRWKPELDEVPGFTRAEFRKSGQWIALNRKHTLIVVNDTVLAPKFGRVFPADEHYVPSLLAMHHLDNETTCSDGYAHVMWSDLRATHPMTYSSEWFAHFNPPKADFMADANIKKLFREQISPQSEPHIESDASILEGRRYLMGMWSEYQKHKDAMAHLRHTMTSFDVFNGRCAFYALSPAQQVIRLPTGAQRATSYAPVEEESHMEAIVRDDIAFAQWLVTRQIVSSATQSYVLPSHILPSLIPSKNDTSASPYSQNNGTGIATGTDPTEAQAYAANLTETLPCHFSGRKFPSSSKMQILFEAHTIFQDPAFDLRLSTLEIFNRTLYKHLRWSPTEACVFLLDQHQMIAIPDVRALLYPISVSQAADAKNLATLFPKLSSEETLQYKKIFCNMVPISDDNEQKQYRNALPDGTAIKIGRDNTIYLIVNQTRCAIPNLDTALHLGLSSNKIQAVRAEDVQDMIVGPTIAAVSRKLERSLRRTKRLPSDSQIHRSSSSIHTWNTNIWSESVYAYFHTILMNCSKIWKHFALLGCN